MKMDQLATYCFNKVQELAVIKAFGLTDTPWAKDHVSGDARVRRKDGTYWEGVSTANLMFNYKFGTEYEILTYRAGRHWHMENPSYALGLPFLSHVGFHLEDDEPFPTFPEDIFLVQELRTTAHTNEYLLSKGRTYHYQIFDTRHVTGFYSKYIKRVHANG